ncbi:cytochrome P450 [Paenibacillus sp. GYB003]|uniref:cytochrome P450 n=1 Tax=Paenibacillus sp. GYB003 TaxID=2994392 RepID=UPI002F969BF1
MSTNTPAGPKGLPITGNLLAFRKNPLRFLEQSFREYGELVHLRFGPSRHLYLLTNPDWIKEVLLTKQHHFRKAKGLQTAKAVVGEGILTSEGDKHLRQRRLMQPSFRKDRISLYGDSMVRHAERLIERWRDGETRVVTDDMMKLTLDIITETMFGTQLDGGVEEIGRAIDVGMKYVSRKASSIIDLPAGFPTKSNREFQEASKLLDGVIYSIIERRRKHAGEGGEARRDLLSMLLAARDEDGSAMTDEQVRDEVMTIFIAGHETTANTLSWTWYLLTQNPEAERKFHDELDAVLGGRAPTVDDLEKLNYLQLLLWESMRVYPAVWAINREVADEVEIGGHRFRPGDTIMMSQYVMHRNPNYYDDPERFRPERFENDFLKTIPQFAYFPFGGGPRVCIGNNFALMEAALILATIGRRYKLRLADRHPPIELEPLVTLRPKPGLTMVATARQPK